MKPILFNTEMVRAILENRKTVTRRVVKPQPYKVVQPENVPCWCGHFVSEDGKVLADKPPYRPGDILYVRETWTHTCIHCKHYPDMFFCPSDCGTCPEFVYKADGVSLDGWPDKHWRPSIHMPREAARNFLRVTGVSACRVQDITDEEAQREGCADREDFHRVWNACYAKPRPVKAEDGTIDHYESYPWEEIQESRTYRGKPWYVIGDPWVWGIEFERISKNEV